MLKGMSGVFANLDKWYAQKRLGIEAVGRNIAAKAQIKAKAEAPWQPNWTPPKPRRYTGHARQGLKAGTQWDSATAFIIYLAHSVDYGPYLELANDSKWAIIEKTLNSFRAELLTSVKAILNA